jgi:hypothetical protein
MVFFLAEKDCMGMGHPTIQFRDIVAILFGHPALLILRPKDNHHLFVGECFVYGLMDG